MRLVDRKQAKGKLQPLPFLLTFMLSGLWHGLNVGYFFSMFGMAFLDILTRRLGRTQVVGFVGGFLNPSLQHVLLWVWTRAVMGYLHVSFVYTDYSDFIAIHATVGYWVGYALPGLMLLTFALPTQKRQPRGDKAASVAEEPKKTK